MVYLFFLLQMLMMLLHAPFIDQQVIAHLMEEETREHMLLKVLPPGSYKLLFWNKFINRFYGDLDPSKLFAKDDANANLMFKLTALQTNNEKAISERFFENQLRCAQTENGEFLIKAGETDRGQQTHVTIVPLSHEEMPLAIDGQVVSWFAEAGTSIAEQTDHLISIKNSPIPTVIRYHSLDRRNQIFLEMIDRWLFSKSNLLSTADCFFIVAYLSQMYTHLNGLLMDMTNSRQLMNPVKDYDNDEDFELFLAFGVRLSRAFHSGQFADRVLMIERVVMNIRTLCMTVANFRIVQHQNKTQKFGDWEEFCPHLYNLRAVAVTLAIDRWLAEGKIADQPLQMGDENALMVLVEQLSFEMQTIAERTEENGTGQTKDGTGQTQDGKGQTQDGTKTQNGKGKTQDGTGQTKDGTRQTQDGTGQTKDGTRQTQDGTGQTQNGTGQTQDGTAGQQQLPKFQLYLNSQNLYQVKQFVMLGQKLEKAQKQNAYWTERVTALNGMLDHLRELCQIKLDIGANFEASEKWNRVTEAWASFCPHLDKAQNAWILGSVARWLQGQEEQMPEEHSLLELNFDSLVEKMEPDNNLQMNAQDMALLHGIGLELAKANAEKRLAPQVMRAPGIWDHLTIICTLIEAMVERSQGLIDAQHGVALTKCWEEAICGQLEEIYVSAVMNALERWRAGGTNESDADVIIEGSRKTLLTVEMVVGRNQRHEQQQSVTLSKTDIMLMAELGAYFAEVIEADKKVGQPEGKGPRKLELIVGIDKLLKRQCSSWTEFRRKIPQESRKMLVSWSKICKIMMRVKENKYDKNVKMLDKVEENMLKKGMEEEVKEKRGTKRKEEEQNN